MAPPVIKPEEVAAVQTVPGTPFQQIIQVAVPAPANEPRRRLCPCARHHLGPDRLGPLLGSRGHSRRPPRCPPRRNRPHLRSNKQTWQGRDIVDRSSALPRKRSSLRGHDGVGCQPDWRGHEGSPAEEQSLGTAGDRRNSGPRRQAKAAGGTARRCTRAGHRATTCGATSAGRSDLVIPDQPGQLGNVQARLSAVIPGMSPCENAGLSQGGRTPAANPKVSPVDRAGSLKHGS